MHTLYAYGLLFLLLTGFLFVIQVIMGPKLQRSALSQWTRTTTISAARGEILDRTGKVLATNAGVYKVVVWPNLMADNDRVRAATELSKVLGIDYETVLRRCSSTRYQEIVLKRQVDSATCDAIRALKLGRGVGVADDSKRYYPMGSLLSQVIGFTNIDNSGQAGLELSYNEYLAGTDGRMIAETDSSGNLVAYGVVDLIDPIDGLKLTVTCDSVIESYLENALAEAMEVNNAKSAQGIVMDCRTGAILAISTQPGYDPNDPPRNDLEKLAELSRNRIVTDVYEPGSTFKIITLSAAIDSGAADLDSSFFCGGKYLVNGESIHCWRLAGHGSQDLTQAAENSCNCAFMQMALRMGKETFYDYIYSFGFGRSTESGLLGETSGIVTHQKYITDNDLARIGFGQSIAVTPIQLASAVCAAVNGGELHQPHIIERMTDKDGNVVYSANTAPIRRVISEETSAKVRRILQSVVDNGTGRNCKIAGYSVGGKTGTAQKYDEYGRVAQGNYICSFIGFAPAEDPRYVCLILVDEPRVSSIFGSTVAAPFVKNVLEDLLHYSGVTPNTAQETVQVPDVTGLTAAEAKEKLEALGLFGVSQSSGEILAQVPAAGETVAAGFQILLYTGVNEDEPDEPYMEYVEMPDLKGKTPLQVYDILTGLGLVPVFENDDPSGEAYDQSISPDSIVAVGQRVLVLFKFEPKEEEE
ncbi:MAG: PASTA domain-containing protein [Clostridiales bacterium]|nr:PASTA domain-containing protein [Clostridiales bacterium]